MKNKVMLRDTFEIEINNFWKWFCKNSDHLIQNYSETNIIDKVLEQLIKIQRGLAIELEYSDDEYILTISADGIEDYFETVKQIVNRSPKIPKWKIVAFRQAYPYEVAKNIALKVYGYKIDPNEIMFCPIIEDGNLYIQIYSPLITLESKNKFGYGCLLIIDTIIGEYACVKEIDGFEYYNISDFDEKSDKLEPLIEIGKYINSYIR